MKNTKNKIRRSINSEKTDSPRDFIRTIIREDIKNRKGNGNVHTRFPPEPNGYLHIGHAKSICLNFGLAKEFNGKCNLRFDDTNPEKESSEYVESIIKDVSWLGFSWDGLYYASDYFDKLYDFAVKLIKDGMAYVDSQSQEQIRENRGTLTEPGKDSPYRNRSVEENLDLFERMKAGEFEEGTHVLRSKIDMAHKNLLMRDPTIYRIRNAPHHRTGTKWNIYPMYDFTHCLSDSLEKITHSICTLEFENNRVLYDWFPERLKIHHPRQIEFARLNLSYTVLSKRKLNRLVKEGFVHDWDDPRMPTISGLRRRGYTPEAIREFCRRIRVARSDNMADIALLEYCLREDLNKKAPRVMAVLNPVKVIIENYPENQTEYFEAENNPESPEPSTRKIPFSREIYIEQEDFMENPPKKFFRLGPGMEVRLKHAYYIQCIKAVKNEKTGNITELRCTYDPKTRGGWSDDGRKVKGTLHWVSAREAVNAKVRLYDHLFLKEDPESKKALDFISFLNPDSLKDLKNCKLEPSLAKARPGERFQFLRLGYFCVDKDSTEQNLIFNRTTTLRDSWAKISKKK